MSGYKSKLQLDRTEVSILMGLVFLLSGLMFTLGVLIGYGARPPGFTSESSSVAMHEGESHSISTHGSRSPASVFDSKKSEAGAELKRAFREAKQRSLTELVLKEGSGSSKPKSVVDTQAHFEAHSDWTRAPASAPAKADDDTAKNQAAEAKRTLPSGVKGLFERKTSSIEGFAPTPGAYTVQIASYPTEEESQAKVGELRKSGFNDAYAQRVPWKNGENWYRVSVGSFPSPDWAKKTGTKLVHRKLASDFVVRQVN